MRLTFLGTGASCAIPVIGHLDTNCACRDAIRNPDGPNCRNNVALLISLAFSEAAGSGGSSGEETSRPVEVHDGEEADWHHILIDCGKTFRNACLRVLAPLRVRVVDALVLTHGHADAMQCVEELCSMQTEAAREIKAAVSPASSRQATHDVIGSGSSGEAAIEETEVEIPRTLRRIPTYLTYPTLEQIEMVSRDLVRSSFHVGPAPSSRGMYAQAMRETADAVSSYATETSALNTPATVMDLFFLDEARPMRIYVPVGPNAEQDAPTGGGTTALPTSDPSPWSAAAGLPFYSFPVEHGPQYISMCFVFGSGTAFASQLGTAPASPPQGGCVVYMSDVSAVPANSMTFLLDLVKIDVLVLDLLAGHGSFSSSHYCADQAIPMVVRLAPRRVYFVGMFCSLEHHSANAQLVQELAELKAEVRREVEASAAQEACSPEDAVLRARKQRFLEETMSMELAYDGQQLNVDT